MTSDHRTFPTVTFWGAAQAVTGSMHLVEAAGRQILLDCGAVRSHRFERRSAEHAFPFAPPDLTAVVLSHAHIDHCGHLPHLVRQGFTGPIYCTPATRDLVALMLADSARIQEEEDFVQGVVSGSAAPPGSRREDVQRTLRQCVAVPYEQVQEISPGVTVRLVNAGHILGSAMVALTLADGGPTLTFTGDLGRPRPPLLREPAPVPAADLLISESTYGGRTIPSPADAAQALEALVRRSAAEGGKVLIPAFSLGRTQVVTHFLDEAMGAGRIPTLPVFVDSPLAADLAEVYRRHPDCLSEEGTADRPSVVRYVRSAEESQDLSTRRGPAVIVAPGGMCDGGRIVRHLKHHLDDPRCSVVLVSYQAPHSLGRRLLEPRPKIRFHGRDWNRWAEIVELPGFSGHPDQHELLGFLRPLAARNPKVRLVHGEPEQAAALAGALRQEGFGDVGTPAPGEAVIMGPSKPGA